MEFEPQERFINFYDQDGQIRTAWDWEADDIEQLAIENNDREMIFYKDPRVVQGQLAWPERFPDWRVAQLKVEKGTTAYSAQFQQNPVPRGGGVIKNAYWQRYEIETELGRPMPHPGYSLILCAIDTSLSDKETSRGDPSAGIIWGFGRDRRGNARLMMLYAWTQHLSLSALISRILDTCTVEKRLRGADAYGFPLKGFPVDRLLIENKAGAQWAVQELNRYFGTVAPFTIEPINVTRDKMSRVLSVEPLMQAGLIWAPKDIKWADDVIKQTGAFPFAKHDEFADCLSMTLKWCRDNGLLQHQEEIAAEQKAEAERYRASSSGYQRFTSGTLRAQAGLQMSARQQYEG